MRGFELRGAGPSSDGSALGGLFRFFSLKTMKKHLQAQCIGPLVSTSTHLCPSGLAEMAMGTCSSIVHKIKS